MARTVGVRRKGAMVGAGSLLPSVNRHRRSHPGTVARIVASQVEATRASSAHAD
ncbi:MAG: hypothetical protein ACOYM2_11370 [Rectinemataceae bacterium]